jgi:hypothetical protein
MAQDEVYHSKIYMCDYFHFGVEIVSAEHLLFEHMDTYSSDTQYRYRFDAAIQLIK